jgi:hypothetical protein
VQKRGCIALKGGKSEGSWSEAAQLEASTGCLEI